MTRRGWSIVAVLALLAVAGAGYLMLSDGPAARVAELMGERGEKQLNEPMRGARGGTRVLVFALDGVGEDELLQAIRSGRARRMAALLGTDASGAFTSGHAVPGVLSVLPSTTLAAWVSVFTGEPPARSGVPGNEWFAREERAFYAPAPVTIEDNEQALAVYTDGLLGGAMKVPTLYERADVRSYVALSQVHRGADLLVLPDLSVLGDLVSATVAGVTSDDEGVEQAAYSGLDVAAVDQLLETIGTHGPADLQVVYFPGIDLYTHVAEQSIDDQLYYLAEVLDSAVGRVLDAYEAAGILDDTYVVFVSDHGHTPVLDDDRHSLGTTGDSEPPALLRRLGFRMRPFELELADDEQDFQATVAYQGAIAYVYLADRSTCVADGVICDWVRGPRYDEDVLPVIRAFDAANRTGAYVPALQGTLDLIFSREPRRADQDALPFRVWDGETLADIPDYLARNPRPDLLDLAARMDGLAAGPYGHRAGDILLLAKSGTQRPVEDRYYFSSEYRSWHGSPTAQDSRIPLVVARRGMQAARIEEIVRGSVGESPTQLDVMQLILDLLASDGS
jgi:hypothetical protein